MKKFAAVIAVAAVCTTSAFAGGEYYGPAYGPAPAYAPAYAPAACAPACAPVQSCGTPCVDPFSLVRGVAGAVGSLIGGVTGLFGCNPC